MVYKHTPALDPGVYSSIHIDSAGGKKPDPDDLMPRLCAICIPHAGVEYERAARNADVIITETGGKLAHMATVARESGRLLIRVDNACDRLPPFTKINFNMTRQTMEEPMVPENLRPSPEESGITRCVSRYPREYRGDAVLSGPLLHQHRLHGTKRLEPWPLMTDTHLAINGNTILPTQGLHQDLVVSGVAVGLNLKAIL